LALEKEKKSPWRRKEEKERGGKKGGPNLFFTGRKEITEKCDGKRESANKLLRKKSHGSKGEKRKTREKRKLRNQRGKYFQGFGRSLDRVSTTGMQGRGGEILEEGGGR